MFEQLGDDRGLSTALRIQGDVYRAAERLDEAASALRRGLQLAESTGNAEEIGANLINLGLIELARGALEEAIACDERAIEQFARIGIKTGQANGYGNLAEKLMFAGRLGEALEASARALDLARTIGDLEAVADITKTVAAVKLLQGKPHEAAATAQESAQLYVDMGALPLASEALTVAAEAFEAAGERERARQVARRARELRHSDSS